jgi:hypothetical protein
MLSNIEEVACLCAQGQVDTAFVDIAAGSVRLLCGETIVQVSLDLLPELDRLGYFPSFVADYLRSNALL